MITESGARSQAFTVAQHEGRSIVLTHLEKPIAAYTALITDASHCAGPSFVQMGKALGAKVIAATKDAAERDYLCELGADKVIVTEEQDLLMQINKITDGRGVDTVFDGLGGPQMSVLGDVLAPRGSLVLYGLQGGNQTPFPACAAFHPLSPSRNLKVSSALRPLSKSPAYVTQAWLKPSQKALPMQSARVNSPLE